MGKEQASVAQKFTLTSADIFNSRKGYALNDFGMACQGILVRQHAIISDFDNPNPHIIKTLNQEIAKIREEHAIPEEALPFLKEEFNRAVKQQEAIIQGIIPNTQGRV